MWTNKDLRKASRSNLKNNYWACIVICFLMLFFSVEYATSGAIFTQDSDYSAASSTRSEHQYSVNGSNIGNDTINNLAEHVDNENLKKATKGVMASLANGMTQTAHSITFAYDAAMKIIHKSSVATILVAFLGIVLSLAYYMFLQVQLIVGERRFFIENRLYHETRPTRVFFIYTTPNVWNVAKIMFVRDVCFLLWCFTIVGGIMKLYEYREIAYILAENPAINRKDCFKLAKELTYGHKMEMFKFDFSYLPWMILGVFSFGLLSILFINPYYRAGQTEVHVKLRENVKAVSSEHADFLNNPLLYKVPDGEIISDIYPGLKVKERYELSVPWNRKYTIVNTVLIFFAFAMIGWCWEVFYHFILDGTIVNRGSLWGPWIPIYGVGGAAVVVLLKPLGKKPPLLAACTFIACGILEYFTAWYFETFRHIKFWDYSNYLFNLDGRICLEGLIMFTILASLGLYIIAPRFDNLFNKWPLGLRYPLAAFLVIAFLGDITYTHFHPHTGKGISSGMLENLPEKINDSGSDKLSL